MAVDYVGTAYAIIADALNASDSQTKPLIRSFVRYDSETDKYAGRRSPNLQPAEASFAAGTVKLDFEIESVSRPFPESTFKACGGKTLPRTSTARFRLKIITDGTPMIPVTSVWAAVNSDLDALSDPTSSNGRDIGIVGADVAIGDVDLRIVKNRNDPDADGSLRRVGVITILVLITY